MPQPQIIELDGKALKAEAEKSHEFKTLAYYGAHRQRNSEVTDIEQMRKILVDKHNEKLHPERWLEAFKKLEDMGMGALIFGRRGSPNRFRWNYSLKAIGAATMNGMSLTAHRIVPRKRGSTIRNDYFSAQPSNVTVKHVDEEDMLISTKKVAVPVRAEKGVSKRSPTSEPLPSSKIEHHIYVALRSDFVFEADFPHMTEKEADALCAAIKRCVVV
jgi:hypothetical protein